MPLPLKCARALVIMGEREIARGMTNYILELTKMAQQ
jgi:hypothetical protein